MKAIGAKSSILVCMRAVATRFLGSIECSVTPVKQHVAAFSGSPLRQARADGDLALHLRHLNCSHSGAHSLHQPHRLFNACFGKQDNKFLAAKTPDMVALP